MKKKILKKMALYFLAFIAAYLVIGNLLHRVIFPEKMPPIAGHFTPGQQFYSSTEKFRQTVIKQEHGFVHVNLLIEPFAGGPPKHIHENFDETFQIENGELSVWIDGEVKKLLPGQVITIPKGTPHQPFNETGDSIRLKGSFPFPEKFAFQLPQVYGYMDNNPDFATSPKTVLQMALFQGSGFDSYLVDGPPMFIQKATGFIVGPLARALGYRSYYKEYDVKNEPVIANNTTQPNRKP